LKGSMIVLKESGIVMLIERSRRHGRRALRGPMVPARARLLPRRLEPLADPREELVNGHLRDPVEHGLRRRSERASPPCSAF
jgi:hypothetical protein